MKINIISVNFRYDRENNLKDVIVRFNCVDEHFDNLSGGYTLTAEEYEGNKSNESLAVIAEEKLKDSLGVTS
ncbi:hypothetical protein SAMN05216389_13814 [Oceanobacillus limi]|uniref:Uncharacterized protein n=1 Tax=Oceanobacillus limi TaxID=930131 RepID=A0A1I0HKS6_9BACI|nr:hypothetical protein [Oceanobacillus limi]SET84488.1 hypothetical protein SAMN05216389_13814 [Oceanobacillus limi]